MKECLVTTGVLCIGEECETEEEAWLSFKEVTEVQFRKLKGFKIWRTIPSLYQDRQYEKMKTSYVVKGRIMCAVGSIPEKWVDATAEGPYVQYIDFDESKMKTSSSEAERASR